MQIKIDRYDYDRLTSSDKLRYIFIKTDKKFENQIFKSRTNLQIPINGLDENDFNKFVKKNSKQISREVKQIIKNFPILNSSWTFFLKCFLVCNKLQFYPSTYSYSTDDDGNIILKLSREAFRVGSLEDKEVRKGFQKGSTQTEFTNWVKGNWKHLEMASRLSQLPYVQTTHKRYGHVPEYENLENIIKIINGKANGKRAKDIGEEIDKKELTGQGEKINKAYSRIKNQLRNLERDGLNQLKEKGNFFSN